LPRSAALAVPLWLFFLDSNSQPALPHFLVLPLVIVVGVLVLLHVLISLFLPLRWPAIRGEFQRQLERRLQDELEQAYTHVPIEVAEGLKAERRQFEQFLGVTREVDGWLEQRAQAASIAGL